MNYKKFIFKSYEFDPLNSALKLNYSYDNKVNFTEELVWNRDFPDGLNQESLKSALELVHLVLGISYFKAYLAPEISVDYKLTEDQTQFLNSLYANGLGEFLYINNLDFLAIAKFEPNTNTANSPVSKSDLSGILLPLSGGKDSLLTADILQSADLDFTPLHVTTTGKYPNILDKFPKPILVKRVISPDLIAANKQGAFNGHVPFSAIIDSILLLTASIFGFKDIILSHENSANEATTIFKGVEVNHQFSKTTKFTKDLQNYTYDHINPNINIFSMLSKLSELDINKLFVEKDLFTKYLGLWSSCNQANYKLGHDNQSLSWCGQCSKCANAFLLLAPFVSKQSLVDMFDGKNLLADDNLQPTFNSLLGDSEAKPFECVAEINELREAVGMLQSSGDWPEAEKYNSSMLKSPRKASLQTILPGPYQDILKTYLSSEA